MRADHLTLIKDKLSRTRYSVAVHGGKHVKIRIGCRTLFCTTITEAFLRIVIYGELND